MTAPDQPQAPRRGQPPKPPELRKQAVKVMLTPAHLALARELGAGNLSKGLGLALDGAIKFAARQKTKGKSLENSSMTWSVLILR